MHGQDKQVDNQSKGPGAARLEAERARIAKIKAKAAVPSKCGPDIISAPARGAFVATHRVTMVPNGVDDRGLEKWSPARTGYGHRASVRAADVFDRMIADAGRKKRQVATLSPGQIAIGRTYRAMFEHLAADGTKLSKLDAPSGGGGSLYWMDHRLELSGRIELLRIRIGAGMALAVRRIRPSDRGADQRGPIMDRTLVDMVCLKDMTIEQVLKAHGWVKDGRTHEALSVALRGALDRMIGYRGEKSY